MPRGKNTLTIRIELSHIQSIFFRHKESGLKKILRERALRHFKMIDPPQIGPQKEEKKIGGTELSTTLNIQEEIMKQIAAQLNQKEDMLYVMALKG